MELIIGKGSRPVGVLFDKLEGSTGMAVLLMKTVGCASIREEHHNLVNRLRIMGEEILPEVSDTWCLESNR